MDESILENINESGVKLLTPLTSEETYATIVKEALQLVKGEDGMIYLEQNGELKKAYASSKLAWNTKPRKRGYTYDCYKSRISFILDTSRISDIHPEHRRAGVTAAIFVAISYKNKSIGVLEVRTFSKHGFSQKDLEILKLFGSLASLAIRKAQLYEETKKALEIRDLFISIASHELRTPLTSLNGYIQLLSSKMKDKDTTEAKYVHELTVESTRLTNLVKELLEVNRIKQGQLQLNLRECSLNDVIIQTVGRLQFKQTKREIIYTNTVKKGQDIVIGDAEKLLQVFSSILNNAYKFSKENSKIVITLEKKAKELCVLVQDEGKGIAGNDLARVFEGFYKGLDNHQEGMGVGLMLAKYIIESHNGRININSELHKGTTIGVCLPQVKL